MTVVLGMLAGRFLLPAAVTAHCGAVINLGLYLLLFLVGLDMGRQGNMLRDIRAAGFRVFLVPLATAVGTLALTALVGFFLPSSSRIWLVLPGPHSAGPLLPERLRHRLSLQHHA